MDIIIKIINFLHLLLNIFIVVAPFTKNQTVLLIAIILLYGVFIQFLITNNKCIVTMLEHSLKGSSNEDYEGFIYRFIKKIFPISKQDFNGVLTLITLGLAIFYSYLYLSRQINK